MDPASVIRTLSRHKVLALALLVVIGMGLHHVVTKPFSQFDSTATLLLVPPVRAEPGGARQPDNPYLRDYKPAVVVSIVGSSVNSETTRRELVAQGADERYEVLPPSRYGITESIAQMTATAPTAEAAKRTAELVAEAFERQLREIQAVEGIEERQFIRTRVVRAPSGGIPVVPGRTRAVAGVIGLGFIGLFSLVSTIGFVEQVRRTRRVGVVEPAKSPA